MHLTTSSSIGYLQIALVLGTVSCSSPQNFGLVVHVQNLTDNVASLDVNLTRNGQPAKNKYIVNSHFSEFGLKIPFSEQNHGLYEINVTSLDDIKCEISSGLDSVDINANQQTYDMVINLKNLNLTQCESLNSAWKVNQGSTPSELTAVWGLAPDKVWAVGYKRLIMKWDGVAWSNVSSGTENLYGIWGINANNIWAVGANGLILKWNGSNWTQQASGTTQVLFGIWGTDASNIWVVGDQGTILNWNGSSWASKATGRTQFLHGIWGSSYDAVWAVGEDGLILRWNGSNWLSVGSGTLYQLNSIWGSDANNIWTVGQVGTILRWNGTAWVNQGGGMYGNLYTVWGTSKDSVFAGGGNDILRWNGGTWMRASISAPSTNGIWGSSLKDVWSVGSGGGGSGFGVIYRFQY